MRKVKQCKSQQFLFNLRTFYSINNSPILRTSLAPLTQMRLKVFFGLIHCSKVDGCNQSYLNIFTKRANLSPGQGFRFQKLFDAEQQCGNEGAIVGGVKVISKWVRIDRRERGEGQNTQTCQEFYRVFDFYSY